MSSHQADSMRTEIAYRQQRLREDFGAGWGRWGRWGRSSGENRTERQPARLGWSLRWVGNRPRHS